VLAALVLGLGAFMWLYERKQPSTEERAQQAKKVLSLESDAVEAVTLEWDGQRVRLEREPAAEKQEGDDEDDEKVEDAASLAPPRAWRLVEPFAAPADRLAVERLLDGLTSLEKRRTLTGADRKGLGLEPPRAKAVLTTKEGDTALEIGAEIPASGAVALAVAGRPEVFVVDASIHADLTKAPGEWRSRELFPGQRADVERITLAADGSRLLLARRGDSFWLESPLVDRADREKVDRLVGDLAALRVQTFLDPPTPPPAELGLEPPQAVVEAVLEGREAPFRLELGAPSKADPARRYGRVGTQLFETDTQLAAALGEPAEAWRSLALSGLEVYRVDKVAVSDAQGTVELERSGPDWKRGPDTVPFTAASDFLYAVTGARGEKLLGRAAAAAQGAALGEPEVTIQLTASDRTPETLKLYAALAGGLVPATADGRDAVLLLPPAAAADLRAKLQAMRTAKAVPETTPPAEQR
jgi:hypothetical protein